MTSQWDIQNTTLPREKIQSLAKQLEISPLLAALLVQRGLEDAGAIDRYLSPGLRHLPHWKDWAAVQKAAQTICNSIASGHKIAVWGDYDVDGITATALLFLFFKKRLNLEIVPILPHRSWGYGLNTDEIDKLAAQGVKTLITVDCGITAKKEIAHAKKLGLTTIITDHHTPAELPDADAILNPCLAPCPVPHLAGVGVAFYLAAALNNLLPNKKLDIREYLDLVALGTVADLVPLSEQNRILVKNGMLLLQEAKRIGIAALKKACGLTPDAPVGTGEISFELAPRLNAAGRIDNPTLSFELLTTTDKTQATRIAAQLEKLNTRRKELEKTTCDEAKKLALTQESSNSLVLYAPHWDGGIIGIAASKMVETFYKPCLMITKDGDQLKGSGRSISQIDLYQALDACQNELQQFGGHRMAAGFSLLPKQLPKLAASFEKAVCKQLGEQKPVRNIAIDALLPFSDIDLALLQEIELMQPFGTGNRRPIFQSQPVTVQAIRTFGSKESKHLELKLQSTVTKGSFQAIAWNMADKWQNVLRENTPYILAFRPQKSTYRGLTSINLQLEDIKVFS